VNCYLTRQLSRVSPLLRERLKVDLHTGRIVDATVKAIIERTDGKRLQVDFGKDGTALIHLWQVVKRVR
jgi:hypothetical protein